MATITTLVQPFKFEGQPLSIRGAAFMANVLSIAKLSPNGQGFITTTPDVYAFDTLDPGVVYFVRSLKVPYDIPEEGLPVIAPTSKFVYSPNISTATVPMLP